MAMRLTMAVSSGGSETALPKLPSDVARMAMQLMMAVSAGGSETALPKLASDVAYDGEVAWMAGMSFAARGGFGSLIEREETA